MDSRGVGHLYHGIASLGKEVFGPFLHLARFSSDRIDAVIDAVSESGYGLTLGLETRIDETVERVRRRARVGNFYVNRTMIGATVGNFCSSWNLAKPSKVSPAPRAEPGVAPLRE